MSGLGSKNNALIKQVEMKTRNETLRRIRLINMELRRDSRVQQGLTGLQVEAVINRKQATLINKAFKAAINLHKFSSRFELDKQCAQLMFPSARTVQNNINNASIDQLLPDESHLDLDLENHDEVNPEPQNELNINGHRRDDTDGDEDHDIDESV